MKPKIVKVPENLFRALYVNTPDTSVVRKMIVSTKNQKDYMGLQVSDGLEAFLIVPNKGKSNV